ncbi:putative oxidoreductase [Arthrobacter globiformis]|uniref:DoxX family protein n=1 Tax=Arthrobacter globiformis TaxID=1665 RepID=UPI002781206E|nr:DoxX family protein [Arthrobacter globiformis]MDQ1060827.1 putative oxidoreductase [Arthrobacter globiformis]
MDEGILLLRVVLAVLVACHGTQKLFGWFGGGGIQGTAPLFAAWGLRPAPLMVAVAGTLEVAGAASIASGTVSILGTALVFGTMLVAASVSRQNGIWAAKGGYELPLLYGLIALGLGVTGPGRYSVDQALALPDFTGMGYTAAAAALSFIGASPLLIRTTRTARKPA